MTANLFLVSTNNKSPSSSQKWENFQRHQKYFDKCFPSRPKFISHFTSLSGILIKFLSEANTSWSQTKKVTDSEGKEREETESLTGHEEYFQISYYLLGGKNSNLDQ